MASRRTFDYIIVGGGSAGCVLANRISANRGNRVLLLEAGGRDSSPLIHVPLGVGKMFPERRFDWDYDTEPEPNLDGRRIECARGKVLGGSSSVNVMDYVRGHRGDYDRWAGTGLSRWSYAEVLPYFKRSETWEEGEDEFRGGSGPWRIRRREQPDPLFDAYIEAGLAAGYPFTEDHNGARQEGFCRGQANIADGRRQSASVAFLRPAMARTNLTVRVNVLVTRVVLEGGRAIGVEYRERGSTRQVWAERETILCGGVINSPQLLMLSGIGEAAHLQEHGIAPVVDSPGVGQNLQDHLSTLVQSSRRRPGNFRAEMRYDRLAFNMARAYLAGTGPATRLPSGVQAFLKSDPDVELPDIQFLFLGTLPGAKPWFPGLRPWQDGFICRAVLLRPESRGTVRLGSGDPEHPVRIQPNFLSTEGDVRLLRRGLRMVREVLRQPPLADFLEAEIAPGPAIETDDEVDAYIRATAATAHHPLGTCRMGVDDGAVVDPELRVRGVEGLRVVDASVIPDLVGGNIHAPVIMVAEKAADYILDASGVGVR